MKHVVLSSMIAVCLLVGCASFEEAYYTDRELGKSTAVSFDRMIVNQDRPHAGEIPEGLDGIHAEPVLESFHKTFSDNFTREDVDITTVGPQD